MEKWIPITQYAIEEGVSVSTLRRKIKANSIAYRLDNGRYLIRSEMDANTAPASPERVFSMASSDDRIVPNAAISPRDSETDPELEKLHSGVRSSLAQMDLKWKALEVRLNGLAKKVDYLIEQNSELNMLVKVFEEKLNGSI